MTEVAHYLNPAALHPDTHQFIILAKYEGRLRAFGVWAENDKDAVECVAIYRKWRDDQAG